MVKQNRQVSLEAGPQVYYQPDGLWDLFSAGGAGCREE
jgi:hypothetical protein